MIPRRFGTGCYAVCRDSRVRFGPRLGHAAWRYRTIRSRQPDTQPSITSLAAFWIRQALMQARVASLNTTPLISDFDIQRLMHALSPSGHFTKHAASPCRSPSESAASWAVASGSVVAAIIQSTDKVVTAIL